jgi:hypothetical protein
MDTSESDVGVFDGEVVVAGLDGKEKSDSPGDSQEMEGDQE